MIRLAFCHYRVFSWWESESNLTKHALQTSHASFWHQLHLLHMTFIQSFGEEKLTVITSADFFLECLHSNIDKNSVNARMEFSTAYVPLLRSLGSRN